ncbi:cytochrome c oxidase assembly protein [Streptomyces sp. NPDC057854]|uniref:cytochrome c oxidase assembly protein n=1 Tax=unclassified Streptomyces TaxID=2593676 RepID=UPI00367DBC54
MTERYAKVALTAPDGTSAGQGAPAVAGRTATLTVRPGPGAAGALAVAALGVSPWPPASWRSGCGGPVVPADLARVARPSAVLTGTGLLAVAVTAGTLGVLGGGTAPVPGIADAGALTDRGLPVARVAADAASAAAGVAALVATAGLGVTTVRWARAVLVLAVAGVLPPAFTGHAAGAANHDAAVTALALHVAGVALWTGGLAFLVVAALRREDGLAVAARRFSVLAGGAFLAVAASGAVGAVVRLPSWSALLTTAYGVLVTVKLGALLVLGACGRWHRRRTLAALAAGGRRPFLRLVGGEVLLMGAATGLAVGLSRTPPPASGGALTPAGQLLGFPVPPPLGDFPWTPLLTPWHFDPLFAFGTGAAGLLYAAGVRKLRARGDAWPVGRTVAWTAGLAVTVLATMSGLAVYGKVMMSVPMGQHMILAMTVPILLVLGAPATLALRALPAAAAGGPDGPRERLLRLLHSRYVKVLSRPVTASALFIGSAFAVYYTSLFATLMRSHLGHMLMLVHFLAAGLLFFRAVIGVDPGPRRPPHLGRLFVLILTMPFHSWFSISLMSSVAVLGEDWWTAVARPCGPSLLDDQYNGGAIAWATGDIPVLITTIILAVQWVRSDAREARRVDRQIDRGDANDPLAAYNAYLAALQARDRPPRPPQPAPPAGPEPPAAPSPSVPSSPTEAS